MSNRVIFFIASHVHALDLAGPLQVFYEAAEYGHPYQIVYVAENPGEQFSAGLSVTGMAPLAQVQPAEGDVIFIPGFVVGEYTKTNHAQLYAWLRQALMVRCTWYRSLTAPKVPSKLPNIWNTINGYPNRAW
jgi:putative intracellular protease/amidase